MLCKVQECVTCSVKYRNVSRALRNVREIFCILQTPLLSRDGCLEGTSESRDTPHGGVP